MEVEIVKTKVNTGEFDIQDFVLYLKAIKELAQQDPEIQEILRKTQDFSIQFSIFGITDVYFQVCNGEIIVEEGVVENPNIRFEMTDVIGSGIIKNEIDPVSAYLSGDFKISGEPALAMKLKPFIQKYNKILGFRVSE